MGKTEAILILIIVCVISFGLWFIFSDQIWLLVGYLENSLYPSISAP